MAVPTRLHVSADEAGARLDVWIAGELGDLSRARVQALIKSGAILFADGTPVKPHAKTTPGMELVVNMPPPQPVATEAEDIPLNVLHEDADLIVINKPAGLVVHPAPGHASGTLVNALLFHCRDLEGVGGERRPGIVHRLDRDTSGVMVVAKRQSAMDALARQFSDRHVEKAYMAIVHGVPHPGVGRIETQIGRSSRDRKKMSATPRSGRDAATSFRVTEAFTNFCCVRVGIETGRTHQIRVHMAHIGHPVVGDVVYGGRYSRRPLPTPVSRQMLHAAILTFDHPGTGERVTYEAPLPADMLALLAALRSAR
jgi:23S rRNA pseudouridine1911/1915/1917 synthase